MTAFERYIASGGRHTGLWRLLAGVIVIAVMWFAGATGVLFAFTAYAAAISGNSDLAPERLGAVMTGGGPEVVGVLLLTFAGIWAGVYLAVTLLHRQRFATLFAPERRVRLAELGKGMLVAAAFALGSTAVGLTVAAPAVTVLPLSLWLVFLLPLVALIFLQATAEELIFRGYLLQQLALRSRNPLVWAVLPSAVFGAMHWAGDLPGEASAYYIMTTFLMGLALAALVWRTGSLWAAVGVHVGFNAIGLTVVGAEGVLSGAQLFLFAEDDLLALMRIDLAATAALLAFVLSPWAPFGPPDHPPGRPAEA
jgi:membrane protease YdiL (CAAX protease family)